MCFKISLLIALTITTNVLSHPLSNESEAMASLEASGNDTKLKRQIQVIDFIPDHLAPFKLLTNYKPYDAFGYSDVEQRSGDNETSNPKCAQCNRCSQWQNNAGNSQAIRTVSPSNTVRQNTPSNSIVNRWLFMYVPNPFVAVPRTFNTQSIQPVVNATRVNSVLLNGIRSTNRQTEHTQATGSRNKAICGIRRRCKCCGRISKKKKQEKSDNEKAFNGNEFENALKSDEIDESFETQNLKSSELLTRSNIEDKLLKADITATSSTANKDKTTTDQFQNCNSNRRKQTTSLKNIATDLTEISRTNTTATKTDANTSQNSLKSVARNTTKFHNGDTILTSIKHYSLDSEENDFKRQNNTKTIANSCLPTTNETTQIDYEHHHSKSENNTVTNILIIQKTISRQNSKSIASNRTSESSSNVHQLQNNNALLHTSLKDSLSNSSVTVLLYNHDNNKPLTMAQQSSKFGTKEVESNGKQNLNLVPSPTADRRKEGINNTNLLSQAHNKDPHGKRILTETYAAKSPEVESSSPLSVFLHKIEESLAQPKNVIKENWKIVQPTVSSGMSKNPQSKWKNYSIEDCV